MAFMSASCSRSASCCASELGGAAAAGAAAGAAAAGAAAGAVAVSHSFRCRTFFGVALFSVSHFSVGATGCLEAPQKGHRVHTM